MSKSQTFQSYSYPTFSESIPRLSTPQMIEVDRLMIEIYHIGLIQMMENAGRALALLAKDHLTEAGVKNVLILAGTGGNGGGAMVCARRLAAWGFQVTICVSNAQNLDGVPLHQYISLKAMNIYECSSSELKTLKTYDLIIDGIIGYSLKGNPRGPARNMIQWANSQKNTPVLSLDTPSGLDPNDGYTHSPTIQANATLTLALPKIGLFSNEASKICGRLFLADISVPKALYLQPELSIKIPQIFMQSDIIEIV